MRWVYLAAIVLFAVATLIFAFQNFAVVRVSFLGFERDVPLAVLAILLYILGTFTGSGLFAFLRRSYQLARTGGGTAGAR